ncbi:MAG: hypothetical protein JO110_21445, partial [Acetobacteraceae bacterium]|nr:hypothetical protein [Acetobacteraceae bacterium]
MSELEPEIASAIAFYDQHYFGIKAWFLRPGVTNPTLGDKHDRVCRFCGEHEPKVTFKDRAHAIPEALGNKSLFTNYECDICNHAFGEGIEKHLGNWSKPSRTFARI